MGDLRVVVTERADWLLVGDIGGDWGVGVAESADLLRDGDIMAMYA